MRVSLDVRNQPVYRLVWDHCAVTGPVRSGLPSPTRAIHISTMTIVTYRHRRKRPAKSEQAATTDMPRIVQHTPKGRAWRLPAPKPDLEADVRVKAFFERMIRPHKT